MVLCSIFAPEKLDASLRLDVGLIMNELRRQGILAHCWDSADEIVKQIAPLLGNGDKVVIMSNGGFDGIHQKILKALEK